MTQAINELTSLSHQLQSMFPDFQYEQGGGASSRTIHTMSCGSFEFCVIEYDSHFIFRADGVRFDLFKICASRSQALEFIRQYVIARS
ncbi:hypothetical protein AMR42_14285 [Limnothrix sp. PR1529]|nr:hypothetical protein BCR12_05900 [Limnothrix sp. P13C2]PIB07291.1 hypothetical protein AMR42_14285 [Limnothrix sp. PR1529]